MNNAKPPFDEAADPDLLSQMQRDPEVIDEVLEELKPLLAADGLDIDNLSNVDPDELHAAMTRADRASPIGSAHSCWRRSCNDN